MEKEVSLFLTSIYGTGLTLVPHCCFSLCPVLLYYDLMDCTLPGSSVHEGFPGKNTGVGGRFSPLFFTMDTFGSGNICSLSHDQSCKYGSERSYLMLKQ